MRVTICAAESRQASQWLVTMPTVSWMTMTMMSAVMMMTDDDADDDEQSALAKTSACKPRNKMSDIVLVEVDG